MGLDYKDIINKHYGLGLSGREIAKQLGVSKSGVNDFLGAFDRCTTLGFPLPDDITNYGMVPAGHAGDGSCRRKRRVPFQGREPHPYGKGITSQIPDPSTWDTFLSCCLSFSVVL